MNSDMNTSRMDHQTRNVVLNILLALVCIFVPFVSHIILTFMIANDYLPMSHKIVWLIIVWAIPFLGGFLYLLIGQRRHRLFG